MPRNHTDRAVYGYCRLDVALLHHAISQLEAHAHCHTTRHSDVRLDEVNNVLVTWIQSFVLQRKSWK
jgi:hypothetical protein